MNTGNGNQTDKPVADLADEYVQKLEQLYRQQYPDLAAALEKQFYTELDGDGRTVWLCNRRLPSDRDPYGSQATADEARRAMILYRLMERFNMDKAAHKLPN